MTTASCFGTRCSVSKVKIIPTSDHKLVRGVNHFRNLMSLCCLESLESHRNIWNLTGIIGISSKSQNLRNLIRILKESSECQKIFPSESFQIFQNLPRIFHKIQNLWNLVSKKSTNSPLEQVDSCMHKRQNLQREVIK